jgi:LAO/AO transport system kinase
VPVRFGDRPYFSIQVIMVHELVERLLKGDKRAAARAITHIENDTPEKKEILKDIHPHTGRAYLVGLTGSPGAGKSSLTDRLISLLRKMGKTVGIIAVDPTSPFTGGAILGDRVRMGKHALDPGVFIRSMGTRGSLGGLAKATREAVRVLDAFGSDVIFIETVGVGQSELDIMHVADTTVVVLHPSAGDHIQSMKAGIMEIADIFVVNKADLPGADKTVQAVNHMLDLVHDFEFRPPVLKVASRDNMGIKELWCECERHLAFLKESGRLANKRQKQRQDEILSIIDAEIGRKIKSLIQADPKWATTLSDVEEGRTDPYEVADIVLRRLLKV